MCQIKSAGQSTPTGNGFVGNRTRCWRSSPSEERIDARQNQRTKAGKFRQSITGATEIYLCPVLSSPSFQDKLTPWGLSLQSCSFKRVNDREVIRVLPARTNSGVAESRLSTDPVPCPIRNRVRYPTYRSTPEAAANIPCRGPDLVGVYDRTSQLLGVAIVRIGLVIKGTRDLAGR